MDAFVGFNRELGLSVVAVGEGTATIELPVRPALHNRSGILHGGVVAAMIDVAGALAATGIDAAGVPVPVLTVTLTVSYTGQASDGAIRATGTRRGGGRRIIVATVDVTDAEGRTIAVGEATYARAAR